MLTVIRTEGNVLTVIRTEGTLLTVIQTEGNVLEQETFRGFKTVESTR